MARIGGDEFAALLPDTDAKAAKLILNRLWTNLAGYNANHPEAHLSLSFGPSIADPGTSLSEVLKQADERLYQNKRKEVGLARWRSKISIKLSNRQLPRRPGPTRE